MLIAVPFERTSLGEFTIERTDPRLQSPLVDLDKFDLFRKHFGSVALEHFHNVDHRHGLRCHGEGRVRPGGA